MKRIVIMLCVFLLLGAVVNVAVAWGIASRTPGLFAFWPGTFRDEELKFGARHVMVFPNDTGSFSDYGYHQGFFGLPFMSMTCKYESEVEDRHTLRVERGQHSSRIYALPLRPVWPGFAINTFFYATILWMLFAFPVTLRRWRRVRRGLCAKCAYPVGSSEVCTECGAAVT